MSEKRLTGHANERLSREVQRFEIRVRELAYSRAQQRANPQEDVLVNQGDIEFAVQEAYTAPSRLRRKLRVLKAASGAVGGILVGFGMRMFLQDTDSSTSRILAGMIIFGMVLIATSWAIEYLSA